MTHCTQTYFLWFFVYSDSVEKIWLQVRHLDISAIPQALAASLSCHRRTARNIQHDMMDDRGSPARKVDAVDQARQPVDRYGTVQRRTRFTMLLGGRDT